MANNIIPVKIEFGGVDNITPILGSMNVKIQGLGKKFETLNTVAKNISFTSAITAMTVFSDKLHNLSSHIISGFNEEIESYSTVQDNLNRIHSLFGAEADWKFFKNLNKELTETSEKTRHTKAELSDLAFLIARSGDVYKNGDNFFDAFKQSILLTDAGKGEFNSETAFKFLNSQSNIFQTKKNNIKLSDQVNQSLLAKDLAGMDLVDMDYYQQQFGAMLGISSNANLANFLALEGLLTKHDLKGEKGGTAMRNIFQAFVPTIDSRMLSDDMKQKYANSGIALDFSNKGRNAILAKLGITKDTAFTKDGKLKISILDDFVNSYQKIDPKERLSYIRQIFGKQGLSAGLTLVNYLQEYKKLRDDISNPSLFNNFSNVQADSSRNTLASKITEAKNAWDNFKIGILDGTTGQALSNLVDGFKNIADNAKNMDDDTKSALGILGVGATGIFAISDKLMPVLMTIKLLKEGFTSLIALSAVWNSVLLVNPIFLAIAGIAAFAYLISNLIDESEKQIKIDEAKKIEDTDKKQFDALYTPQEKEVLFRKNMAGTIGNEEVMPTKDNLVHLLKQTKENKNQESISNIINNYNQNLNGKSNIDININGLPPGSKVIQKTQNMAPANMKLGILGGSLQ